MRNGVFSEEALSMKRLICIVILHFSAPAITMDIAGDIIKKQNDLAARLFERTYDNSYPGRMAFKGELEGHLKKSEHTSIVASAHARLGDIFRELHKKDAAKRAYLTAYSDPKGLTLAKGWAALQLAYLYLDQKDFRKAESYFSASCPKIQLKYPYHLYMGWGVAWHGLNQHCNAMKCWEYILTRVESDARELTKITDVDPVKVEAERNFLKKYKARALYNASFTLEGSGNYDSAVKYLTASQRISPKLSPQEFHARLTKLQGLSGSGEQLSLQ